MYIPLITEKIKIKAKYVLLLIVLIAIIAYIFMTLSDWVDLFVWFAVVQALLLTASGNGRNPLFYVQVKERYIDSEDVRETIRLLSYFIGSFLLPIGLVFFFGRIIYLFQPYALLAVINSSIFLSMCLLISGVAFLFIRVSLTKLINSEEKVLIRGGTNE